jgi:hypothetical protein
MTPPEDFVEPIEEPEEFVITDDGMKTDTVVVPAAHHQVDAVHTFSHDTMQNKINAASKTSYAKSAVMGLGALLSTGALVMFALRWKNKPAQDFSGTTPLIDSAFADVPHDVEMPPIDSWASSAVCRALSAAEAPAFDPIKA